MRSCSMTDTGVKREMNQDYFFASETPVGNLPNLFIVADGMGGHKAGEYASRYTIERVVASVSRNSSDEPVTILNEAIQKANSILIEEAREDADKSGMGTTIVVATIIGRKLIAANVGDSRAYYMDSTGLHQITTDHTFVNLLLMQGKIGPEEVHTHPKRNMLTKAVGVERVVVPDFFRMKREKNFTILLCSDGLSGYCSDSEIYEVMSKTPLEEMSKALIDLALSKGGRDNITLAVITD